MSTGAGSKKSISPQATITVGKLFINIIWFDAQLIIVNDDYVGQDWSSLWKKYKEDQRDRVDKLNQKLAPTPRATTKEKKAMVNN